MLESPEFIFGIIKETIVGGCLLTMLVLFLRHNRGRDESFNTVLTQRDEIFAATLKQRDEAFADTLRQRDLLLEAVAEQFKYSHTEIVQQLKELAALRAQGTKVLSRNNDIIHDTTKVLKEVHQSLCNVRPATDG